MATPLRGFTLLELLVTLGLLITLITFGIPALSGLLERQRLDSAVDTLGRSLNLARQEAILRNQVVTLAPLEANWTGDWVVFIDQNHNAELDSEETKLRHIPAMPNLRVVSNPPVSKYVRFNGRGETQLLNGGFQAGRFTLCPRNQTAAARHVIINSVGRWRIEQGQIGDPGCQL
ncbi:MAG: hypothetical protein CVV07_04625 [Gammaproteobacteria bacterium HGW-Gammaproteobacteria-11]|nr:MAG: hypothetical protein CVV07_04625 [Gammaproteobacteria bacterium HGW-Gammaproteobacteria-11]